MHACCFMQMSLFYNYDNYNAEEGVGRFSGTKLIFIIACTGGKLLVCFIEQ